MAGQKTPEMSAERVKSSLRELESLATDKMLETFHEATADPRLWDSAVKDPREFLAKRGIKLPQGVELTFLPEPPGLPPIIIGQPQPFRKCFTICKLIGPSDPRDPDPTRIKVCYILCIP